MKSKNIYYHLTHNILNSQMRSEASLLVRSRHHVTLGMGPVPLTGVRAGAGCGILEVLRMIQVLITEVAINKIVNIRVIPAQSRQNLRG
jgi:hypothetical protein